MDIGKAIGRRVNKLTPRRILYLSIFFGLIAIFVDSLVDATVFREEPFWQTFLHPSPFEIYVRSVAFVMLLVFGLIVARVVATRDRAVSQVEASEAELIQSKASLQQELAGRQQAEVELRKSLDLLDSVASGVSETILLIDSDFRVLWANASARHQYGSDLVGNLCYTATHHRNTPCDSALERCPFLQAMSSRMPATEEHVHYDADGNRVFVEVTVSPVESELGEGSRYVHVCRDITERKKNEEAIRASEAMLKEAERLAAMGSWTWNAANDAVTWSDHLFVIFGMNPKFGVPGLAQQDRLYSSESWERFNAAVKRAMADGFPFEIELQIVRRDGVPRWVEARAETLGGADGKPVGLRGTFRDVTDHKERNTLEAIVSSMTEGLVVLDSARNVAHINRAAERMLGIQAGNFLGKSVDLYQTFVLRRAADPESLRSAWDEALTRLAETPRIEADIIGATRRTIEATIFPIGDKRRYLGSGVLLRDVTREREIDRMKTEFVSIASHELRTPMTAIYGFSELLLTKETGLSQTHKGWVETIHKEARRLSDIVEDLLNVSRIESGRLSLTVRPEPLQPVARDIMAKFEQSGAGRKLLTRIPDDLPPVLMDPDKLGQVLYNLVDNAVKYSPGGGTVVVAAGLEPDGNNIVISVVDQGPGIPDAEIPLLFSRFHRVQMPQTTGIRGTGLGLYIVKSIVEMMNGRVWVKSKVGQGSTFFVRLPAVR